MRISKSIIRGALGGRGGSGVVLASVVAEKAACNAVIGSDAKI